MQTRDLPAVITTPQPPPLVPQEYASAGMSLGQLSLILWAYRRQSLMIAGAVIFAVGVAAWFWPRTYEATATVMVKFEVNDPLAGREFPTGLLSSYMSTQVELVRGSEALATVIDRLKLAEIKEYTAGYSGNPSGLRTFVQTRVQKQLKVEQGKYGSQLIHVTYAARTPAEAAMVANTVAQVYSEQQYAMLTDPANERARRYTEQLADLKEKVDRAQKQLVEYRSSRGLVAADARADVDMHAAPIQTLKAQLALQNTRMAELAPTLGELHPQVLELKSQMAVTRSQLAAETQAFSGKASAELVGAKYQLELQSAQAVYARALDGYDQIMFASAGGYSNVSFVSRATPPATASKPRIGVWMFLAVLFGSALGLASPFCYELLNRRVRCRDDIERDYGIPVLAELRAIRSTPALGAA